MTCLRTFSQDLKAAVEKSAQEGFEKEALRKPTPPSISLPDDPTGQAEREAAERAAREFVENYIKEHGTLPKWELLMKDPKFAAAVEAEDERIRAAAARELCDRYTRQRQLQEKIEQDQVEDRRRLIEEAKKKSAVRATLLEGTESLPAGQILDRVMHNFKNIGFKYTSASKDGDAVLNGSAAGDCQTLSKAFAALAHEIGFPGATVKSLIKDFMTRGAPIVDPDWGNGNAERGTKWVFQNHYWVLNEGKVYDVLFTRNSVDLGQERQGPVVDDPETGLTYEVYGGVKYYAGWLNGKAERYMTLTEGELNKIREAHRQKQVEKPKKEERGSPPPEKDVRVEDESAKRLKQIRGTLDRLVPAEELTNEEIEKTALQLWEVDPGGDKAVTMRLKSELQKFIDGSIPLECTFNKSKWSSWFKR